MTQTATLCSCAQVCVVCTECMHVYYYYYCIHVHVRTHDNLVAVL